MKTFATQWFFMTIIVLWGFASFIMLAGDEDPFHPMPMARFFLIKGFALLSFLLCCYVARRLNRKGLLPDVPEE